MLGGDPALLASAAGHNAVGVIAAQLISFLLIISFRFALQVIKLNHLGKLAEATANWAIEASAPSNN